MRTKFPVCTHFLNKCSFNAGKLIRASALWEDAAVTESRQRRMLLDTAGLYFRAFHTVPDTVNASNGMPMNAVRGLLDMIARLASEFQPSEIVACWDDDCSRSSTTPATCG